MMTTGTIHADDTSALVVFLQSPGDKACLIAGCASPCCAKVLQVLRKDVPLLEIV